LKNLHIKALLVLLAATGLLGATTTSANAKTVWTFGNKSSLRTAPKALRGTWYGFELSQDKHPKKLVVNKKSFTVKTTKGIRTIKYAKSMMWSRKAKNHPNVDLRKPFKGWYYFAINLKPSSDLKSSQFYCGQVLPVTYKHHPALAYVPVVSENSSRVMLLTKKKYNHPVYKSTKHMTVINFYGGKG